MSLVKRHGALVYKSQGVPITEMLLCYCCRGRDVVKTFLHMLAVGTYSRLFEALASMLSRNTLNPADISIVSKLVVLVYMSLGKPLLLK